MKRVSWIFAGALLLPPSAFLLFLFVGGLLERGTAVCMICASVREEALFCGIPVDTEQAVQREGALSRYNRWFEDNLAVSHSHCRRRIGCWSAGWGRVECSTLWGEPFYGVVPDLPDQDMARELAERMLHAPRQEKLRILQYCERVRCRTLEESMEVDMPPVMVERLRAFGSR